MTDPTTDSGLKELIDREAIRDLVRSYAHFVWQKDGNGVASLFASEGEMDMGDRPPIRGRDAIREVYAGAWAEMELQPFVHNHVIRLSGDSATGSCYLDLRTEASGQRQTGTGVYEDRYVREDGEWKFAARKLSMRFLVPIHEEESGSRDAP